MATIDFLELDAAAAPPGGRSAWLAAELRSAIARGRLSPGVRLPATRDLGSDLTMSRGTVVEAYRRLADEGLVTANRGGGTVVAAVAAVPAASARSPRRGSGRRGLSTPSQVETGTAVVDLTAGLPDLAGFPRAAWVRAEREVLATSGAAQLGYGDPQGAPALRVELAGWLARSRGLLVDPDQVIVTAGVTGALSLVLQVLRERGFDACAIEDPGSAGNRSIVRYWLGDPPPVPVDEQGLDVAALHENGVRLVVTTPAHQFPTGVALAPERRRALVAWAREVDGVVVEDDYDSEYRYDRAPTRPVHALDPEVVVFVSSLSKLLAPALRLGWMVAPTALHADLVRRRWATDLGSPMLPQLVLARLIREGVLERQLRALRQRHRQRRNALSAAVAAYLPGSSVEGIAAGVHALVLLPGHLDDRVVVARAAERGVRVTPLSALRSRPGPPGLVIGYGAHAPAVLDRAVAVVGRVVRGEATFRGAGESAAPEIRSRPVGAMS